VPLLEHIMNAKDMQVKLNPNPVGPRLGDLRRRRRTAFSLPRIALGKTDDAPFTSAPRGQDHAIGNPMTALDNVPCNGSRACCLPDMTRPMPERGDLIWIFEHEVMATAVGPTAILQCFLRKCFLTKTRPEQSPAKVRASVQPLSLWRQAAPHRVHLLFRWTRII
jgi:hypothetical protein